MKRFFRGLPVALALPLCAAARADVVYSPLEDIPEIGIVALPIVALLVVTALLVRYFTRRGGK